MGDFSGYPELSDQVLRLGNEESADPFKVMQNFFGDYNLGECRQQLWDMVECCLTTDNAAFGQAEESDLLLQYYKDLEGLIEAASLMVKRSN